jgi:hypothetical protein
MVRSFRIALMAGAMLLAGVNVNVGCAQTPDAGAPRPIWSPPCSSGDHDSLQDRNNGVLVGNPLLDGPRNNLGWFATVDVQGLAATVHNQLTAPVTVGVNTVQVALPAADLQTTVSPRFEVGYRFGEAAGELLVSYRFLAASGTGVFPNFDGAGNPANVRSRLAMQVIDFDYASQEPSCEPWAEMKWRVGIRLSSLFFDSQAADALLQQHVDNYFCGAGPHAALDLWLPLVERRCGLFCKVDAAGVLGKVQQGFEETLPGAASGFTRQDQFMPSFMLNVQAGVGWAVSDCWRVSIGYTYEHWWDAAFAGASRGEAWTQGIVLRGEWRY